MNASRRQFLAASAVVPAGAVIAPIEHLLASGRTDADQAERWAALQSMFSQTQPHPDAELFAAWREYVAVSGEYDALPFVPDAEMGPWNERLDRCRARMETIPARTMDGMALKLRYLLAAVSENPIVIDTAVHGAPVSEAFTKRVNGDFREAMLWRMVQETTPKGAESLSTV